MNSFDKFRLKNSQLDMFEEEFSIGDTSKEWNEEEGWSVDWLKKWDVDMDEVIYEEFKGTGNMEIHLERKIAEKRIYPAINIRRSGTRREDLLTSPEELQRMFILRKILDDMEDSQAIEFLIERLKSSKTNDEFFSAMKSGNGNGKKK